MPAARQRPKKHIRPQPLATGVFLFIPYYYRNLCVSVTAGMRTEAVRRVAFKHIDTVLTRTACGKNHREALAVAFFREVTVGRFSLERINEGLYTLVVKLEHLNHLLHPACARIALHCRRKSALPYRRIAFHLPVDAVLSHGGKQRA